MMWISGKEWWDIQSWRVFSWLTDWELAVIPPRVCSSVPAAPQAANSSRSAVHAGLQAQPRVVVESSLVLVLPDTSNNSHSYTPLHSIPLPGTFTVLFYITLNDTTVSVCGRKMYFVIWTFQTTDRPRKAQKCSNIVCQRTKEYIYVTVGQRKTSLYFFRFLVDFCTLCTMKHSREEL